MANTKSEIKQGSICLFCDKKIAITGICNGNIYGFDIETGISQSIPEVHRSSIQVLPETFEIVINEVERVYKF
jgi:hypothetical protein